MSRTFVGHGILWLAFLLGWTGTGDANTAPVANRDLVVVEQDGKVNIAVLANDVDADGDSLIFRDILQPALHARLLIPNTDGTVHYRPTLGYVGIDSFRYVIDDGNGGLGDGWAIVNVVPPYAAVNDVIVAKVTRKINLDVLSNDRHAPGDSIWVVSVEPGPYTVRTVINTDQTIFYEPEPGFLGTDTLTYVSQNVDGRMFGATVFVELVLKNQAVDDMFQMRQGGRINLEVLSNDRVARGDIYRLSSFTEGNNSERTVLNADGSIHYRPLPDFLGIDTLQYTATDQDGDFTTGTVHIEVISINRAMDDSVLVRQGGRINIDVLKNDLFLGESDVRVVWHGKGDHSERVVQNSDGTIHYRPQPAFLGRDQFAYTILNGRGTEVDSGLVWVEVVLLDQILIMANDSVTVVAGRGINIAVLDNDVHLEGSVLTITGLRRSQFTQTVIVNRDGTIFYRAGATWHGTDFWRYNVVDVRGDSAAARGIIRVIEGQFDPIAVDDTLFVEPGVEQVLPVLQNDTQEGLRLVSVTPAGQGQVLVNAEGQVVYRPAADFAGEDDFTYVVENPSGEQAAGHVLVQVAVLNALPVAQTDQVTIATGRGINIPVLANDSDPEGDAFSLVDIRPGDHTERIFLNPDQTVFYRPTSGFEGTDILTYVLEDGGGRTVEGQVQIEVIPDDGSPLARDDSVGVAPRLNIAVLENDTLGREPIEGILVTLGAQSERILVNSDLTIHYRPADGFADLDVFTYTIRDTVGNTATALVWVMGGLARQGDFDGDDQIGFQDFLVFVQGFGSGMGEEKYDSRLDFDGNGSVDFADFVTFTQMFGK
ncbi:MAG: Ig-like domain-containing protein [bacterium]|nr:Ig-like domain-containing protein [bacterium]